MSTEAQVAANQAHRNTLRARATPKASSPSHKIICVTALPAASRFSIGKTVMISRSSTANSSRNISPRPSPKRCWSRRWRNPIGSFGVPSSHTSKCSRMAPKGPSDRRHGRKRPVEGPNSRVKPRRPLLNLGCTFESAPEVRQMRPVSQLNRRFPKRMFHTV